MLKNKIWLGIILSIILLVFSIPGFTAYYKYTQESGANFYVGIADKADALEDTNEMRQIIDDLGALLVHSKRNDLYPKDGTTGGTLAIPNSALVSFATGTKGDIWYCSATNTWTKLNVGTDNQILVVATDLPNWETPSSDLLSDVASIAMLNENEAITGAWTVTGSIGGVDTTEFGYLAGITSFGGSIIDDADEATFKATVNLEIGTDVLAYQATGIADDNLVEIDDADAAVNDYCKLTANGIVGRSYTEVKTDLGIDLSLYYLKTEINTLGKVETIYVKDIIDSDELAALNYVDTSGTPEANDIARFTDVDTIEGINYTELKTALALDSDDLSDVASIAMLDEAETVTGYWQFTDYFYVNSASDTPATSPHLSFYRTRDGDPTWNVSSGDYLGKFDFSGQEASGVSTGAIIRVIVDGTPGSGDMPARIEFLTTPDDSDTPVLRLAIDSAGNIKLGDGAWTDFVNTTAAGVMTAEGAATITATDLVPKQEINFGANSAGFTVQTITSSEGTATIDWGNSNKARITLSENTTLAFTDPANSGNYLLIIIQPAGDNEYTTTFPAGIYWANGTKVSVPLTNLNRCIVSFAFDDEDSDTWYCQGTETFATDD